MRNDSQLQGAEAADIRRLNSRAVTDALRLGGPMGRRELSRLTGLSFATVCRVLDELIEQSLVTEAGSATIGNARRKTTLVDINPSGGWVAVMDVAGSSIRSAAINLQGSIIDRIESPLENIQGEESVTPAVQSALNDIISRCKSKHGKPRAVGLSSRGIVDRQQGVVKLSFNLQLRDYPAAKVVREVCDVPVVVSNDVHAAALAEARHGSGREHGNFAYVLVGTGVGAGIVLSGQVLDLPPDAEFGLMVVAPEGDPDRFAGRGYLESLASGRGIAAAARRVVEAGGRSLLSDLVSKGPAHITAKDVAMAAEQGDVLSRDVLANAANYLGVCIVNLAHTLGLSLFIVGGGVSMAGDAFWVPLRESVSRHEFWPGRIRLERSMLHKDGMLLGVGALALDEAIVPNGCDKT